MLTTDAIAQIDLLLTTDEATETENEKSKNLHFGKLKACTRLDFAILKTDPGAVGLDSFLTKIKKLKLIRTIGLPANLFGEGSQKLVTRSLPCKAHPRRRLIAIPCRRVEELTDERKAELNIEKLELSGL